MVVSERDPRLPEPAWDWRLVRSRCLREARRVLRPEGRLLVLEHVRAREPGLAAWQDWLTPPWKAITGGCHLTRDTRAAVEAAGFAFESAEEFRERRIPVRIVQPRQPRRR